MESIQKTDRYKVLLIEDNPVDSKLIQEQLKYAKTANFQLQDTDKASTGLELLTDEPFDVVLLDLSLPDASELEALDRIIDYNQDLPIVILTGMRDEELAISALRKGAQDYIIKGQFDVNLLIRAIHYAIERKKIEKKLRQSEEKYRTLFETTKEGIIISKPDGTIVDVNPAAATSLGYRSTEDLKKTPITDIWMDLEQRKKVFRELNQREYVEDLETIGKKKDGNPIHVFASLKAHKDEEGNIRTIDGIFRDITERKQAEIALKQKTHDLSQRVKEINCLYGVSQLTTDPRRPLDEILQQIIHLMPRAWQYPDITCVRITYGGKEFLSSNFQETPWRQTADLVTSGEIRGGVAVYYLKEMPVLFEGPFLKEERELLNGLTREMGSFIERNQANLALQESESQYRQLVNNIQEIIFTLTPEGIITSLNPAFEEQTGLSCEDYINKPFFRLLYPDEILPVLQRFESLTIGEERINNDIQVKTKSGEYLVYEGMLTPQIESGKIVGFFGVAHDITERKKVENELKKANTRLEYVLTSNPAIIFTCEPKDEHKTIFMSSSIKEITGYDANDFIGQPDFWVKGLHPQDKQRVTANFSRISETGYYGDVYRFRIRDGTYRWMLEEAKIVKDDNGNPIEIVGFWTDITERKQIEKALQESEKKYRDLIENLTAVVVETDSEGKFTYVSSQGYDVLGYKPGEVIGKSGFDLVHPDDLGTTMDALQRALGGEHVFNYEYRGLHKDGYYVPLLASGKIVTENEETKLVLVIRNITERKQAEDELRKSEEKYRTLFELAPDIIVMIDPSGRILDCNNAAGTLTGVSKEILLGKHFSETGVVLEEDISRYMELLTETFERSEVRAIEIKTVDYKGAIHFLEVFASLLMRNDEAYAIQVVGHDITERRRVEKALKKSEEIYRLLFESAPIGIGLVDLDGNILELNQTMLEIMGYTSDEIKEVSFVDTYVNPEERTMLIQALHENGRVKDYEVIMKRKDGTPYSSLLNAVLVELDEKQVILTILRDMTQWRELERAKRESEEHYRNLFERIPIGLYRTSPEGEFLATNPTFLEMIGYSSFEEISRINVVDWANSSGYPREDFQEKIAKKGEIFGLEGRIKRPDGSVILIRENARVIKDADSILYYEGSVEDITEQKQAEEELRKSEEHFKQIFTRAPIGVFLADLNYGFLRSNIVFCDMLGYTEEELVKLTLNDVTHPDHVRRDIEQAKKLAKKEIGLYKTEKRYIKKNKENIWARTTVTLLLDEKGEPYCYLAMVEDISKQKQAEDEMKKQLMKFKIEDGNIYLVSESSPMLSKEVFNDLIKLGYSGLAISRVPEEEFKREFDIDFQFLWFSETENRNSLPPQLNEVEKTIDGMQAKSVIWIDRLDYLVLKNSFEETLKSVFRWREIAYLNDLVVVLSVDPTTLPKHHIQSLEKETKVVVPRFLVRVPDDILEILRFVHQLNNLGVKPSYTDIGNELEVSKPTIRKRLKHIVSTGYLNEQKSGNRKTLELTEKGLRLFTK